MDDFQLNEQGNEAEREMASRSAFVRLARARGEISIIASDRHHVLAGYRRVEAAQQV